MEKKHGAFEMFKQGRYPVVQEKLVSTDLFPPSLVIMVEKHLIGCQIHLSVPKRMKIRGVGFFKLKMGFLRSLNR